MPVMATKKTGKREQMPSAERPKRGALRRPAEPKGKRAKKVEPHVLIAVSGGTVQGCRGTTRIGVEVFDQDDMEAEGKTEKQIEAEWKKLVKAFPVAIH
jgi:hypothetical protein